MAKAIYTVKIGFSGNTYYPIIVSDAGNVKKMFDTKRDNPSEAIAEGIRIVEDMLEGYFKVDQSNYKYYTHLHHVASTAVVVTNDNYYDRLDESIRRCKVPSIWADSIRNELTVNFIDRYNW